MLHVDVYACIVLGQLLCNAQRIGLNSARHSMHNQLPSALHIPLTRCPADCCYLIAAVYYFVCCSYCCLLLARLLSLVPRKVLGFLPRISRVYTRGNGPGL